MTEYFPSNRNRFETRSQYLAEANDSKSKTTKNAKRLARVTHEKLYLEASDTLGSPSRRPTISQKLAVNNLLSAERLKSSKPNRHNSKPESPLAETELLRSSFKAPALAEKLAKVIIRDELIGHTEKLQKSEANKPELLPQLSIRELLSLSSKVVVDGHSLRQIYEMHLISESGLRRLIGELLNGNTISKQLRRELIEHEIDFERDPQLRDQSIQVADLGGSSQKLQDLIQQAGVTINNSEDLMPTIDQQARFEAVIIKAAKRRQLADRALITTIIILSLVVTILIFRR